MSFFSDYLSLFEHKLIHFEENSFKCDINGGDKSFPGRVGLKMPQNIDHMEERKYVCDWSECKKTFNTKHCLIEHKRTHTGETPFKCDIDGCDKLFPKKRKSQKTHRYSSF